MTVEFLAGDEIWYPIEGAEVDAVLPDSYRVKFSIAPAWARNFAVLETMTFRVAGKTCSRAYVTSVDGSGTLEMMMLVDG